MPGVLMSLLDDPHMMVVSSPVDALRKLRYTGPVEVLVRMADHPDKNVRDAVKQALRRLNPQPKAGRLDGAS